MSIAERWKGFQELPAEIEEALERLILKSFVLDDLCTWLMRRHRSVLSWQRCVSIAIRIHCAVDSGNS